MFIDNEGLIFEEIVLLSVIDSLIGIQQSGCGTTHLSLLIHISLIGRLCPTHLSTDQTFGKMIIISIESKEILPLKRMLMYSFYHSIFSHLFKSTDRKDIFYLSFGRINKKKTNLSCFFSMQNVITMVINTLPRSRSSLILSL